MKEGDLAYADLCGELNRAKQELSDCKSLLRNIAENMRGCETLTREQARWKLEVIRELTKDCLTPSP